MENLNSAAHTTLGTVEDILYHQKPPGNLNNVNIKDTPKLQKTLHAGQSMREFEETRETLTRSAALLVRPTAWLVHRKLMRVNKK
jgi:hypothetical protein